MMCYMFPGQGAQKKGMGEKLFKKFPRLVQRANDILEYSVTELCLNNPEGKLNETQYTQPALYTVMSLLYLERFYETAVKPNFLLGHSLGEYVALFAAGAFEFEEGLRLVQERGRLMSQTKEGGMAAIVGLSRDHVTHLIKEENLKGIELANDNSPVQVVLSGEKNVLENAKAIFEKAGARLYSLLNVSGAFHSSFMREAQEAFKSTLATATFNQLSSTVIANVTALPYTQNNIIENLTLQIGRPVQWTKSIQYILQQNVNNIEELSPGKEILIKILNDFNIR